MNRCEQCGAELLDGTVRFCPQCGAPVGGAQGAPPLPPPGAAVPPPPPDMGAQAWGAASPPPPRRRRGAWALWTVAGLVVLAAIGVAIYFLVPGLRDGGAGDGGTGHDGPGGTGTGGTEQVLFPFYAEDGTCGYLGKDGTVVIEGKDYAGEMFSEGLAAAFDSDGLYGYLDETGAWAIEPQFVAAKEFSQGIAPVQTPDKRWVYIDKTGAVVVDLGAECVEAYPLSDGRGLVWNQYQASVPGTPLYADQYGYVDKTGQFAIAVQFEWAAPFSEGLAAAMSGGKCGYIDTSGAWAIEPRYELTKSFSDGLGAVRLEWGAPWQYVDKTGAVAVDDVYWFEVGEFNEGLAPVCIEQAPPPGGDYSPSASPRMWGYIDKTGAMVIDLSFDFAGPFSQGLAAVMGGGTWGYIDKTGEPAFAGTFYNASTFLPGGLATVTLDSEDGPTAYIDTTGKVVWRSR